MGLEICGKCRRFHYVPGDCPPPKLGSGERSGAQAVHGSSGGTAVQLGSPAVSDKPDPNAIIVGKRKGRPQTITDMKAYRAQKARERRAKKASNQP